MKRIAILLTMMFLMVSTFTAVSVEAATEQAAKSVAKKATPPNLKKDLLDAQKAQAAATKAFNKAKSDQTKAESAKKSADRTVALLQKQYDRKPSAPLLAKLNAAKAKQQAAAARLAVTTPIYNAKRDLLNAAKTEVQRIKDYIKCVKSGSVSCS